MLIFQASPGAQTFRWPEIALLTTLHTWDDLGRSMQIHISQQISQITEPEEQQARLGKILCAVKSGLMSDPGFDFYRAAKNAHLSLVGRYF